MSEPLDPFTAAVRAIVQYVCRTLRNGRENRWCIAPVAIPVRRGLARIP